jgi:hypothetical protein
LDTRLFKLAAVASAVVCCLIIAVGGVALAKGSYLPFLSLTRHFHVTIFPQGTRTHLLVCNDVEYGPYCGSITVGFAGDPTAPKVSGFSDFPGIYYQHIRWRDQTTLWGLRLNLAYPIVLAGLLPFAWWVRRLIHQRRLGRRGFPISGEGASKGTFLNPPARRRED